MLGRRIADPQGLEGRPGEVTGLGLLDVDTVLSGGKRLAAVAGAEVASGMPVSGYEMHLGVTTGDGLGRPMLRLAGRPEGAVSADGLVAGCYLHGIFATDPFRRAFVERLGGDAGALAYEASIETTFDALADHLEASLDIEALLAAARRPRVTQAA
jgi:adenosylcobyric acid synthase